MTPTELKKQMIVQTINERFKGKAFKLEDEEETCFYQDDEGRRCAIGIFIPDKHEALLDHSDLNVSALLSKYPELHDHMPSHKIDFLTDFQKAHDRLDPDKSVLEQQKSMIDWVNINHDLYHIDRRESNV